MRLEDICGNFIKEAIESISPVDMGHINDTYIVGTSAGRFICQRVAGKMDTKKLIYNYELYSQACEDAGWMCPKWLKDRNGRYFFTDENGDNYRLYPFIEGDILNAPGSGAILYACGQGLARMHDILGRMKGVPQAVYPGLHDLKQYYRQYEKALKAATLSKDNRDAELETIIGSRIQNMLDIAVAEAVPVHADPKLSNMVFKNGKVIGFIDMDTVMQGSRAEDLADCIRSCCVTDGHPDKEAARVVTEGYASIGGKAIPTETLKPAFNKICFELALRYYTDAISNAGHFKEHFPGYRLAKAKALLKTTWD